MWGWFSAVPTTLSFPECWRCLQRPAWGWGTLHVPGAVQEPTRTFFMTSLLSHLFKLFFFLIWGSSLKVLCLILCWIPREMWGGVVLGRLLQCLEEGIARAKARELPLLLEVKPKATNRHYQLIWCFSSKTEGWSKRHEGRQRFRCIVELQELFIPDEAKWMLSLAFRFH